MQKERTSRTFFYIVLNECVLHVLGFICSIIDDHWSVDPSVNQISTNNKYPDNLAARLHTVARGSWQVARARARANLFCLLRETCRVATRSANFLTEIETSPAFSRIFQQVWPRVVARACTDVPVYIFLVYEIRDLILPDSVINAGVSLINESRARFVHTGRAKSIAFADWPRPEYPFSFRVRAHSFNEPFYFAALVFARHACLRIAMFILRMIVSRAVTRSSCSKIWFRDEYIFRQVESYRVIKFA